MLFLQNGSIFNGSGTPPLQSSLLIADGRIAEMGPPKPSQDCTVIDCTGLAVAPGFIDLHSHLDLQVLENRTEKVKQGVTTEVVGNCGFSPFPFSETPRTLQEFAGGILGRADADVWGWPTASDYLETLQKNCMNAHVFPLVGHGTLRVAVARQEQRLLSKRELDQMAGLLEDALAAGCVGFSTGLMYAPGSSAGPDELRRVCEIVARKGKLYATHMRSYSSGLIEAVQEQLDLARTTGCRLQISHLQAAGRKNWGLQRQALDEIEKVRMRGIDVEFDIYPYQCGSTVLTQWLPDWALEGGKHTLMARLHSDAIRDKIADEMDQSRAQSWSEITISGLSTSRNANLIGKTIEDTARERSTDGAHAALELLSEEEAAVNVISLNQSEENLHQLLTHPLCSVISDGFYVKGKAHPRLYGTFPELLGAVTREKRWLSLPEAIRKITSKPAGRLGLQSRGSIQPGYFADLTIFDPATVQSRSTYETPDRDPEGIYYVIKDGEITFTSPKLPGRSKSA